MGHVPRYISTLCLVFIKHGGIVYFTVLGGQRYSRDLPQGGMEIPYFVGNGGELKKVKSFFIAMPTIPGGYPISTNNNQPAINYDQPLMNNDQPAMNYDQPAMNYDQPAMINDQSAMNYDQSAMNYDDICSNKL